MWDAIWYLGFPMFAVSVFGAPYKKHHEYDRDSPYSSDQYDVIYDQRQNGTENYKLNIDGLSLIWSPNSLLAAAALLEPALYGEYPDTNIDVILGPDNTKPEEQPVLNPQSEEKPQESKPTEEKPDKVPESKPTELPAPTVIVIDGNHSSGQKLENPENSTGILKRKLRIPGLLKPFLRKRSSLSAEPVKRIL